jgi:DNA-binding transcriptional ArsR family regulator
MKRLLWWLLAGTRGGINRARIITVLKGRPYNANQLTELLDLDYKTVRHHLEILVKNGVVVTQGEGYGMMYFLSRDLEDHYGELDEIWEQIGQTGIKETNETDDDDK